LTLFRAPESWSEKENPAHEKQFGLRGQDRHRRRAPEVAEKRRERLVTFTTSAMAERMEQAR
jgi:hypothetical protein